LAAFFTLRFGAFAAPLAPMPSAVQPVKLLAAAIQQCHDFIAQFARGVIEECGEGSSFGYISVIQRLAFDVPQST
jgi:hypothetical protein